MIRKESAVSPVVGVLLMLVVTIIIAAIVSGFAGGLAGSEEKAPNFVMDTKIKNTGYALTSYILFDVKGGDHLDTADLRLTTAWTAKDGTSGGNVTQKGLIVLKTNVKEHSFHSPLGFGKGVNVTAQKTSGSYTPEQHFGNYTLVGGTTMKNSPYYKAGSAAPYNPEEGYGYPDQWIYSESVCDGMCAILGEDWNALRPGDTVNVKLTHMPSGKIVYNSNVVVE